MKSSRERILTTHTGSLPRPPALVEMLVAKQTGAAFEAAVDAAVADVVAKQVECGIDVINDGEQGRADYTVHVKDRLTGFDGPSAPPLGTGEPEFPELAQLLSQFASPLSIGRPAPARSRGRIGRRRTRTSSGQRPRPQGAAPKLS